jgi:hypothetical protein
MTAGTASATVTVTPIEDTASEVQETVILNILAGSSYATGSSTTATGTIDDNDASLL